MHYPVGTRRRFVDVERNIFSDVNKVIATLKLRRALTGFKSFVRLLNPV